MRSTKSFRSQHPHAAVQREGSPISLSREERELVEQLQRQVAELVLQRKEDQRLIKRQTQQIHSLTEHLKAANLVARTLPNATTTTTTTTGEARHDVEEGEVRGGNPYPHPFVVGMGCVQPPGQCLLHPTPLQLNLSQPHLSPTPPTKDNTIFSAFADRASERGVPERGRQGTAARRGVPSPRAAHQHKVGGGVMTGPIHVVGSDAESKPRKSTKKKEHVATVETLHRFEALHTDSESSLPYCAPPPYWEQTTKPDDRGPTDDPLEFTCSDSTIDEDDDRAKNNKTTPKHHHHQHSKGEGEIARSHTEDVKERNNSLAEDNASLETGLGKRRKNGQECACHHHHGDQEEFTCPPVERFRRCHSVVVSRKDKKESLPLMLMSQNKELVQLVSNLEYGCAEREVTMGDKLHELETDLAESKSKIEQLEAENARVKERLADDILSSRKTRQMHHALHKLGSVSKSREGGMHRIEACERNAMAAHDDLLYLRRFDALSGPTVNVSLVFVDFVPMAELQGQFDELCGLVLHVYGDCLRNAAEREEGQTVFLDREIGLFAFSNPLSLLRFVERVAFTLMDQPWPELILQHKSFSRIAPVPTPAATAERTGGGIHRGGASGGRTPLYGDMPGSLSAAVSKPLSVFPPSQSVPFIFSGPRARFGIVFGNPAYEVNQTTGKIRYYGSLVALAARLAAVAHDGEARMSALFKEMADRWAQTEGFTSISASYSIEPVEVELSSQSKGSGGPPPLPPQGHSASPVTAGIGSSATNSSSANPSSTFLSSHFSCVPFPLVTRRKYWPASITNYANSSHTSSSSTLPTITNPVVAPPPHSSGSKKKGHHLPPSGNAAAAASSTPAYSPNQGAAATPRSAGTPTTLNFPMTTNPLAENERAIKLANPSYYVRYEKTTRSAKQGMLPSSASSVREEEGGHKQRKGTQQQRSTPSKKQTSGNNLMSSSEGLSRKGKEEAPVPSSSSSLQSTIRTSEIAVSSPTTTVTATQRKPSTHFYYTLYKTALRSLRSYETRMMESCDEESKRVSRAPKGPLATICFVDIPVDVEHNPELPSGAVQLFFDRILPTVKDQLRRLLPHYCGYEVKAESGCFMIAFWDPQRALLFACALQNQLLTLPWPQEDLEAHFGGIWGQVIGAGGVTTSSSTFHGAGHDANAQHQLATTQTSLSQTLSSEAFSATFSPRPSSLVNSTHFLFNGPRVRVGIDCGAIQCSLDPVTGYVDYTSGDCIVSAAQALSHAKGGEILVGTSMYRQLKKIGDMRGIFVAPSGHASTSGGAGGGKGAKQQQSAPALSSTHDTTSRPNDHHQSLLPASLSGRYKYWQKQQQQHTYSAAALTPTTSTTTMTSGLVPTSSSGFNSSGGVSPTAAAGSSSASATAQQQQQTRRELLYTLDPVESMLRVKRLLQLRSVVVGATATTEKGGDTKPEDSKNNRRRLTPEDIRMLRGFPVVCKKLATFSTQLRLQEKSAMMDCESENTLRGQRDVLGTSMLGLVPPTHSPHITFLFCDCEGSEKLAHAAGEAFVASQRHLCHWVKKLSIEHDGYIVKHDGHDSFFLAFENAYSAVLFAVGLQLKLNTIEWPPEVLRCEPALRIRDAKMNATTAGAGAGVGSQAAGNNNTAPNSSNDNSSASGLSSLLFNGPRVRIGIQSGQGNFTTTWNSSPPSASGGTGTASGSCSLTQSNSVVANSSTITGANFSIPIPPTSEAAGLQHPHVSMSATATTTTGEGYGCGGGGAGNTLTSSIFGPPIPTRKADFSGGAVNVAFRISRFACGGEILISKETYQEAQIADMMHHGNILKESIFVRCTRAVEIPASFVSIGGGGGAQSRDLTFPSTAGNSTLTPATATTTTTLDTVSLVPISLAGRCARFNEKKASSSIAMSSSTAAGSSSRTTGNNSSMMEERGSGYWWRPTKTLFMPVSVDAAIQLIRRKSTKMLKKSGSTTK